MNVPPEVAEVVRRWIRKSGLPNRASKAQHDVEAARRISSEEEGCPYDTACFHCQQGVEKYLKALLTLFGVPAPRTHDLEALNALLPAGARIPVSVEQLAVLNPYAVGTRYADDWREPVPEEAARAFSVLGNVQQHVLSVVPSEVWS